MKTTEERFWSKVDKTEGCWEWKAGKTVSGYGIFYLNGCTTAHRVSYGLTISKVSSNMTIDHLCRNRSCVNPSHLEVCSIRENTLRGLAPSAINFRKTKCIHGHSDFRRRKNGKRVCMTCARISDSKRR